MIIRRYLITGSKRASNYWWAFVISFGGLGFLLTGFASFLNTNVLLFNQSKNISFFPQGLIMCFYGSLGLLFGMYLWCTILWGVGNGFNEFNKQDGSIRIFRWGLPGKDRRIDLLYKISQVERLRVELNEGVNPRRTLSLQLKSLEMTKGADQGLPMDLDMHALRLPPGGTGAGGSSPPKERGRSLQKVEQGFKLKERLKKSNSSLNVKEENQAAKVALRGTSKNFLTGNIPLTRIGQPLGLQDIESEASELAQFLQVALDSFYEV